MPKTSENEAKYITLKEAAKLSGYAPDYLGQLIRKGKLRGKRVFLNEAWVTTEEDVRDYLTSEGKGKHYSSSDLLENKKFRRWMTILLYTCLGFCAIAALFMFYAFSAILDHSLHENAVRSLERNAATTISP